VDDAVFGRVLDRCSSFSFGAADEADGLSGDGDDGRESEVAGTIGKTLIGDVTKLAGPPFEGYGTLLISNRGRGGASKESTSTVPSRRVRTDERHTHGVGAYRAKPRLVSDEPVKSLFHQFDCSREYCL
jgi:hypothetical protein